MAGKRILHLTDPHLFAAVDGELRGVRTAQTLESVLAAVRNDEHQPDVVIVTGDISQDESRDAYLYFRERLVSLDAPIICLPGNHDDPSIMCEVLDEPPFQYCGTAALGGWRLHFLSTWIAGATHGRLGASALGALEADLAEHDATPTIVFLHHHPVPTGSRWLDELGLEDAAELLDMIDRHRQVRGLVWGHVHQAVDERRSHCRLIATPSTCRQFRPYSDTFAVDGKPPAWRWLLPGEDGVLRTELRWLDED